MLLLHVWGGGAGVSAYVHVYMWGPKGFDGSSAIFAESQCLDQIQSEKYI